MQYTTKIWKAGAVILAASILLLAPGCRDAAARQAATDLRDATDKARLACETAVALMRSPVIEHGEKILPQATGGTAVEETATLRVRKASEPLNPNVLPALQAAETLLQDAISAYTPAPDAPADRDFDLAAAYGQLARTRALKADYYSANAARDTDRVENEMLAIALRAADIRTQADLGKYYDRVATAEVTDLQGARDSVRDQAAQKSTRIGELDREIATRNDRIATLTTQMAQSLNDARDLQIEAQADGTAEPMKVLNQALAKLDAANAAASEVAKLENEVQTLSDELALLTMDRNRDQAIEAALAQVLQAQGSTSSEAATQRDQVATAVAESTAQITERLRAMKVLCGKASEGYQQADKELTAAGEAAGKAMGLSNAADLSAGMADVHMQYGAMCADRLRFHERLTQFQDNIEQMWAGVPAQGALALVSELPSAFLASPEATRTRAKEQYSHAVRLYGEKALPAVQDENENLAWAYQGQLATAYIGLYRVDSSDTASLDKARDLLATALEGKTESPFVSSLIWWQRQLQR